MTIENWKPDPLQELLLKSALLNGEEAWKSMHQWEQNVDIDLIERSSHRLLSMVYKNLEGKNKDYPLMNLLKGVYKKTWFKNQILFHQLGDLLKALNHQQVKHILLKGSALTLLYYKDYGLRAMEDLDILIKHEDINRTLSLLENQGWSPRKKHKYPLNETYFPFMDGVHLRNEKGCECDLQWTLMEMNLVRNEYLFWENAKKINFQQLETYTLNSADQLLHICEHALTWRESVNIRWVADAFYIVQNNEKPVEWDYFVKQTHHNHLTPFILDMLFYLKHFFKADIPDFVFKKLKDEKPGDFEKTYYQKFIRSYKNRNRLKGISRRYYAVYWSVFKQFYKRKTKEISLKASLLFVLRSLQVKQNVKHLWCLPLILTGSILKRIYVTFTKQDRF